VRLLTWNVAGRVSRQEEQARAVAAIDPDLVALQEVTPRTWPLWREALGMEALWSLDHERQGGPRALGVVLAARAGLERVPLPGIVWPERALAARVGPVTAICAHSPISPSPDLAKVRFHEALLAAARELAPPALLAGDLNTPRRELPDGSLLTFAHASNGSLRADRGERWDAAEQALLRALGWTDAFRDVHGPLRKEPSWAWPHGGGYRLDHVLVTPDVSVRGAVYLHELRTSGLSDHSGLVVEVGGSALAAGA
jgi:endonuclease/exonuclease/phosphatase family metal-dependent hydrolase